MAYQRHSSICRCLKYWSSFLKKALSGLRAWTIQRLTAVYMLVFCIFVLFHFAVDQPRSYHEWQSWITAPFTLFPTALFFLALLAHTGIGLRDIAIDYISSLVSRLVFLTLLSFSLIGLALWVLKILLLT
ncbi:MAG: succinate dehydrogenase, hydrophobic membrane anchor protein [Proteobacteria bacterium]|nr:MAG: succinate dehydrogenase, hydrophobic membrane anchor protein [Pseudomonadota bacterium]